ncbi:MAG: amidohydrolase, partial [Phormidesmis sp. FL-bin-119]|nr:amidohydrolase [Pedobacter sp.]
MGRDKPISRRYFIAGTGALVAGMAMSVQGSDFLADEPIIDIHQHTDYAGRTQEQMHAHQRAMGIATTILLPAGRSLSYGSTHYGVSNGLQVKAGGNEICYKYAVEHKDEFT